MNMKVALVRKAVIVDIDGTVSHRSNREIYDYSKVIHDTPDQKVIEVVNALWMAGNKIIFISARDDSCFNETYRWLTLNCPPFVKLYMRKYGDFREDSIVKREIYEQLIAPDYDILCVLDDRQQVVDMWRELGLKCLQVEPGNF